MSNKPKNRKNITQINKSAASLVLLFAMLIMAALAMTSLSLGWYSENKITNADGMVISTENENILPKFYSKTKDDDDFQAMSSADISFENMYPGDRVSFKIVLENRGTEEYYTDVILRYEGGCEVPLVIDFNNDGTDEYYYFGTQLRVINISSTDTSVESSAYNTGAYLVPNESGTEVSVTEELSPESLTVADSLTLPGGTQDNPGVLTVLLDIEFINLDISQNAYQGFGSSPTGECSRRRFYIDITGKK